MGAGGDGWVFEPPSCARAGSAKTTRRPSEATVSMRTGNRAGVFGNMRFFLCICGDNEFS